MTELQNDNWKVGVYLFGRRAHEIPDKEHADQKKLYVEYRLNAPIPVTKNVKKRELADPKRLQASLDEAFEKFKAGDSFDFSLGKWSYAARPVRARESCLSCHSDLFVLSKLGDRKYTYRPRRAGDSIGVLVYAVRKKG